MTLALLFAATLTAQDPNFLSAQRKANLITEGKAKPGSVIVFTPAEINAWAKVEVPETVPDGLREPRVVLGSGAATAYAIADFLKMRHASGQSTNWFLAKLLEGERPLRISIRVESGGGKSTVHLTRVEVGRVAATGTVLDFLIKTFFLPLYPSAKIGEPFDLGYDMEKIEIRPAGVHVTIKTKRADPPVRAGRVDDQLPLEVTATRVRSSEGAPW